MIPNNTNKRILELYSSRRNRTIYPNPSSFEVNFAPTVQPHCEEKVINDPVCKGSIYYSFTFYPPGYFVLGPFLDGSTQSNPIIFLTDQIINNEYKFILTKAVIPNFFVGWNITNYNNEDRIVTSFDPQTGRISLDKPFTNPIIVNSFYEGFILTNPSVKTNGIYLPHIDTNSMVINKNPQYYNGYYIVFESVNPLYSNSLNSNIFYRKIVYYDTERQFAYFDKPLNFDPAENQIQNFTIRKKLPLERWTLKKQTYYNKNTGYWIVTLPNEASSVDNYYKGKYIYVVSNTPQTYSPPLPPQDDILPIQGAFYPIYGLTYISSYNGTTKEASVKSIQNKYNDQSYPSCNIYNFVFEPKDLKTLPNLVDQLINEGDGLYKVTPLNSPVDFDIDYYLYRMILYIPLKKDIKYDIVLKIKKGNIDMLYPFLRFVNGNDTEILLEENIQGTDYNSIHYTANLTVDGLYMGLFFYKEVENVLNDYFEYSVVVSTCDTINIVDLDYDNYAPLDYNGTMVSTNQTVCYEISIESLTLPNKKLLTGSSISFYPFVYVQIENATSPTSTSHNTIISNNPASSKAIFSVYVPQVDNPDIQKFVSLTGGGTQIVKFKPNDNLRFSVYLPDGSPFQTLLPDTLSPYPPDPELQIHAVFSLVRINDE